MKLLGRTNQKQVVASVSHYECVSAGEGADYIMCDGGQPHTNHFAGYSRGAGEVVWFEVPQTFAELFEDYQFRSTRSGIQRKYGIWNIEDVRILPKEEWPDINSIEVKAENFIWGTNGVDGKQKTRYILLNECSLDHLKNILNNVPHLHEGTREVIEYLIDKRECEVNIAQ
jgi:hypothetical protein